MPEVRDPRIGTFQTLVMADSTELPGPWVYAHNGFGDHNFIHLNNASFVPPSAIRIAKR